MCKDNSKRGVTLRHHRSLPFSRSPCLVTFQAFVATADVRAPRTKAEMRGKVELRSPVMVETKRMQSGPLNPRRYTFHRYHNIPITPIACRQRPTGAHLFSVGGNFPIVEHVDSFRFRTNDVTSRMLRDLSTMRSGSSRCVWQHPSVGCKVSSIITLSQFLIFLHGPLFSIIL